MNFFVWMLAMLFGFMETSYYGWHTWPESEGELICNGIVFLLLALSCVVPRRKGR